jgi:pimeloyl-ACP methyl ester carboxylesterase
MERFEREGLIFDVVDAGPSDGEPVVLLHGFPQDSSSWTAVSQALTQAGYRTLAPDQRGYSPGARPPGRQDYTDRHLVDDVWALLDAAGLDQAHVVGHDWGGAVAWATAADGPDRVTSVSVFSVPHPSAVLAAMRRGQAWRSWYFPVFLVPGLAEWLLEPGSSRWDWFMQGLPPERVRHYADRMSQPGAFTAALNWYRAIPAYARRPVAGAGMIALPTLFAWGSKDPTTTPAAAESTRDYVSGPYTYRVLEDATHWLPETRSSDVADLLLAHLSAAHPAGSTEADV